MIDRVRYNCQRTQPEKIHLEKPESLYVVLIELRDKRPLRNPDGYLTGQRILRNHNTRRMDRRIARQAFDFTREINHSASILILLVDTPKIRRLFERTLQCNVQFSGNKLCNGRHFAERHFEHAPDIANCPLCPHRAERGNLCDMILPIAFLDIRNDPPTIHIVKININIRHGHAFGVEETLE